MAARTTRTNTPTEQNKADNELIVYRLTAVEDAVKELSSKLDKQDNIKRSDLVEFRDSIILRFNEVKENLQKQIDKKADASDVEDIKKILFSVSAFFSAVIGSIVVFYLTKGA